MKNKIKTQLFNNIRWKIKYLWDFYNVQSKKINNVIMYFNLLNSQHANTNILFKIVKLNMHYWKFG